MMCLSYIAFIGRGVKISYDIFTPGWEYREVKISYHTGTVRCPFTTGRGIGTETFEMDNVFAPDDL